MYPLIYRALQQRLQTQVEELRYIDYDTGQFQENDFTETTNVPAVLIDLNNAWNLKSIGKKEQHIDGQIKISIISFTADNLSHHIINSASHFNICRKVYLALQNYQASLKSLPEFETIPSQENRIIFNSLERNSQVIIESYSGFRRMEQTYKFITTDFSAALEYQNIEAQVLLNIGFSNV